MRPRSTVELPVELPEPPGRGAADAYGALRSLGLEQPAIAAGGGPLACCEGGGCAPNSEIHQLFNSSGAGFMQVYIYVNVGR